MDILRGNEVDKDNLGIAIVRPFSSIEARSLPYSFEVWNKFLPCNLNQNIHQSRYNESSNLVIHADLYLSYSQSYTKSYDARKAAHLVAEKIQMNDWGKCFGKIYTIEADIPPDEDIYKPSRANDNDHMWVNGPNRQFESAFRSIQGQISRGIPYDVMFLMEGDSVPVKDYWLDSLAAEIHEKVPFAILGSKYDGDSWNKFRDQLPMALLHHINGNAMYNLTHPLLLKIINQLESEANTSFNSIPYDYRISQIIHEGSYGVIPKIKHFPNGNEGSVNDDITSNTKLFKKWRRKYGANNPIKESRMISNFAASNVLPKQLNDASIVHGAKLFLPWDYSHKITLVVSEWYDGLSSQLLSDIESIEHPFNEITLMLPPDIHEDNHPNITTSSIPVQTIYRTSWDFMDICNAPVTTDWFMITNCYYSFEPSVDLLLTNGKPSKPVIPFTPVDETFCLQNKSCKEKYEQALKFDQSMNMVIEDMDMVFNTHERNAFCKEWQFREGVNNLVDKISYNRLQYKDKLIRPTATAYVAYLKKMGKADDLYEFSDRTIYGTRDVFNKVFPVEEAQSGRSWLLLERRMRVRHGDSSPVNVAYDKNAPTVSSLSQTPSTSTSSTSPTSVPAYPAYTICQKYCYTLANVPWRNIDPSSHQKCDWEYSCSGCPECSESTQIETGADPNALSQAPSTSTSSTSPTSVPTYPAHTTCQKYCYTLANVPWHNIDPSLHQKCDWEHICSGCPECSESTQIEIGADPNILFEANVDKAAKSTHIIPPVTFLIIMLIIPIVLFIENKCKQGCPGVLRINPETAGVV